MSNFWHVVVAESHTSGYSIPTQKYRYLKQGLTITGLGSPTFDDAIMSACEIYNQFHRQFADGKLEAWSTSTYSGYHALDMSNRYLTPRRDAPSMEHIPFARAVDPKGTLEAMAKSGYIHGDENIVHYYTFSVDAKR